VIISLHHDCTSNAVSAVTSKDTEHSKRAMKKVLFDKIAGSLPRSLGRMAAGHYLTIMTLMPKISSQTTAQISILKDLAKVSQPQQPNPTSGIRHQGPRTAPTTGEAEVTGRP
jgi:hypothetical protein